MEIWIENILALVGAKLKKMTGRRYAKGVDVICTVGQKEMDSAVNATIET